MCGTGVDGFGRQVTESVPKLDEPRATTAVPKNIDFLLAHTVYVLLAPKHVVHLILDEKLLKTGDRKILRTVTHPPTHTGCSRDVLTVQLETYTPDVQCEPFLDART